MRTRTATFLFLAWLLLLPAAAPSRADHTQVFELDQADFLLSAAEDPPAADRGWRAQALPDHWIMSRPGYDGSAWYRFRFTLRAPGDEIQSVYLPRLVMNAGVYLNGVAIGNGGSLREPVTRNWNRPLFFLLPPHLLRSGENILHVRLVGVPRSQATLFPVRVGPERLLRSEYENAFFWRITLNQAITLIILAIGGLMLSLWWRRRQDTMYALFGASALVWSISATNLYVREVPLASAWWEVIVNASLPAFVSLLMLSLLGFAGRRLRVFECLLRFMACAALPTLALVPAPLFFTLTALWHGYALLATLVTFFVLAAAGYARHSKRMGLLAASIGAGLLFGLHDWVMHTNLAWVPDLLHRPNRDLHLVHYAAPLVFLVVGWIMTARFVDALNDYERLNADLERRVAAKHDELAENFARLDSATRERATFEERQRIVADMHDGLGAQLLTALRLAESGRIDAGGVASLLRECLDDMRIVMNSLTPGDPDLDGVLGSLRYRLAPRIEQAGVALDWRVDGASAELALSPEQSLQVQRIVQESLSNILKHSGARTVVVATADAADRGGRWLRISDDGRGITGDYRGRGIANMHNRAQRIGGELRIESTAAGTTVALWIPASADASA